MRKYCANLHTGLYLDFNDSTQSWSAAPCCEFSDLFPISSGISSDYWTNPNIIKLRQENLAGADLPEGCSRCVETEASGNKSRRQGMNERFGTHWTDGAGVVECNFQADYTCNLACRICNSNLSTTWRKYDPDYKIKTIKVRPQSQKITDLLTTAKFHELKQIQFQGGEPLLTHTHMEVLERLQDYINLDQVSVSYNSNGTVKANDRTLKFWEKFRMVEIYFSIDDIGPRFEYQRWPASWSEVSDNMIWYKNNLPHNALLGVERTIGVLNAGWAHELDEWIDNNFDQTRYGDKIHINYHYCSREYGLQALSQEYIDYILKNVPKTHWVYNTVGNLQEGQESDIKTMLQHLKKHDLIRSQDYSKIYPEFTTLYKRFL